MKIVAISDTHTVRIKDLPTADLLIHSGDWSSSGSYQDTRKFLDWLKNIKYKFGKIICVPGNHDIWVEHYQQQAKQEFNDIGVSLLIDEEHIFMDTKIYGNPWSPQFGNWSFMATLEKRQMAANCIPDDTSILITHSPPKGYLDVLGLRSSEPGKNAGCEAIRDALFRVRPELHICGHLHENSGIMKVGETLLVNAASLDEYYKPVNGFKTIYL